jgi:hypothetical protein
VVVKLNSVSFQWRTLSTVSWLSWLMRLNIVPVYSSAKRDIPQ